MHWNAYLWKTKTTGKLLFFLKVTYCALPWKDSCTEMLICAKKARTRLKKKKRRREREKKRKKVTCRALMAQIKRKSKLPETACTSGHVRGSLETSTTGFCSGGTTPTPHPPTPTPTVHPVKQNVMLNSFQKKFVCPKQSIGASSPPLLVTFSTSRFPSLEPLGRAKEPFQHRMAGWWSQSGS